VRCESEHSQKTARQAQALAPKSQRHTPAMDVENRLLGQESTSIRVNIDKVDNLVNLVGELVITQSMLSRFTGDIKLSDIEQLKKGIETLERNTHDLQEQAMNIRMLPIDFVFQRLPRLVRDLCESLGKLAELKISGSTTEIDKTVLEKIADPLVHLVRNALDHGIETPSERIAAGKPEAGIVELNAFHEGGNIIIHIKDDGAGLKTERILAEAKQRGIIEADDELSETQIRNLIFQPGFSTAAEISDVSGRGVGMDVVKQNIIDLGGNITFNSTAGAGSECIIRLPLTLAIVDGQLVRVGEDIFIIPLLSIIESIQINPDLANRLAGKNEVYRYRDDYIIKSLQTNFRQVESIAGATILGDGTIAMILDLPGLIRHFNFTYGELRTTVASAEEEKTL